MDPNANLTAQRALFAKFRRQDAAGETYQYHDLSQLADLVMALDDWIPGGGFLPADWARDAGPEETATLYDDEPDTLPDDSKSSEQPCPVCSPDGYECDGSTGHELPHWIDLGPADREDDFDNGRREWNDAGSQEQED